MRDKWANKERGGYRTSVKSGYVRSVFLRILAILAIAIAIGFANMLGNPKSPKYGKGMLKDLEISFEKLPYASEIVWIDARAAKDYELNHVRDSILLNEDIYYVRLNSIVGTDQQYKTLVVYCGSDECSSSINIVRLIRKDTGLKNVYALQGGWETIKAHNLPIASSAREREEARLRIEAEKAKEKEAVARAAAKALLAGNNGKSANGDNTEDDE
jgi:rhodanese-related sulfurtransferase